jgi:hypothetical protein
MWDPQHLTTTACYGDSFTLFYFKYVIKKLQENQKEPQDIRVSIFPIVIVLSQTEKNTCTPLDITKEIGLRTDPHKK